MNYLAHLHLSGPDPETMLGGLLGDFVKGPLQGKYSEKIELGIQLHRKIDVFTDEQPEVRAAIARFQPPMRRFAGIIIDLSYDHFLAANWRQYNQTPLPEYCDSFYRFMASHYDSLPAAAQRFSNVAPATQWLESYADVNNLEMMLQRIGQRFRKPVPLDHGFPQILKEYDLLAAEFQQCFARIEKYADSQRQLLSR